MDFFSAFFPAAEFRRAGKAAALQCMAGSKRFDPEFGGGKITQEERPDTVPPEIISFPIAPGKKDVLPGLIMGGRVSQVKKNQGLSRCGIVGFWEGQLKEKMRGTEISRALMESCKRRVSGALRRKPMASDNFRGFAGKRRLRGRFLPPDLTEN